MDERTDGRFRQRSLLPIFVVVSTIVCSVQSQAAQLRLATGAGEKLQPQSGARDSESCRSELIAIMDDYAQLADLLSDTKTRDVATEAIDRLEKLSPNDLSVLQGRCGAVAKWHAAIQMALDAATSQRPAPAMSSLGPGRLSPGFPDAEYSELCGAERPPPAVIYGVLLAKDAAEGFWFGLDRACNEVLVALGEGGNTSLLCIPADFVRLAAGVALEGLQFCLDDVDAAEINGSYLREDHIHGDLEQVDAGVATIDSKVDALTTKVDALTTKVDTLNAKIDTINATLVALAAAVDNLRAQNCELIRLVNTPQGQRSSDMGVCSDQPGFPYNFPEGH